ncbi:MAG: hypothetical protein U5Q44_12655 [Dehalococcoidia bacterium]|nr:hypothetical protein [Dehalococcoidia bacterium]
MVLRAVVAANARARELGSLFFVVDESMREVSRFTANGGGGPVRLVFDGQKQLFMIEGAAVTAIDIATGAKTRLVSPQEIADVLEPGAAFGVAIAGQQVVAGQLYVDVWASSEGQRYLGSVPGLKGHSIEAPHHSGRSLFAASPRRRRHLPSIPAPTVLHTVGRAPTKTGCTPTLVTATGEAPVPAAPGTASLA